MNLAPDGRGERAQVWLVCLGLIAMTLAVYFQVRGFQFVNFDDPKYVTTNAHTQAGLTLANVAWAFTTGAVANWHPVTWLSHMADVTLFGSNPGAHHLTSVAFHAANAVLLFLLLRAMTGDLWPSAVVAALFAIHPLHVESVAWVSERKDVLSMFFALATLLVYARGGSRRPVRAATLVLYALGLMAKPMVVTLPLLMLILDRWPLGRTESWFALVREKVPLFALAALSSLVTFLVQRAGGAVIALGHIPFSYRLGNALMAYGKYLWKMVWPFSLAPLYPFVLDEVRLWKVALALAVLAAVSVLAVLERRRRPYLLAGWLWYLVSLLPVIGLVQVGSQAMADRYSYLPLVGPFIMLAWAGRDLASRWRAPARVLAPAGAVLALLLMVRAHAQTAVWHDSVTLFQHDLRHADDNFVVRTNLAEGLLGQGRYPEAVEQYQVAVAMRPEQRISQYGLAVALAKAGRREEAVAAYRRVLALMPRDYIALSNLGDLLVSMGRREEAIPCYQAFLALEQVRMDEDPEPQHQVERSQDARMRIGFLYRALGRDPEALRWFKAAADLNPRSRTALFNLGLTAQALGRKDEADRAFQAVLKLDPGNAAAKAHLAHP